ncbi:MAG: c-type cytochrome domain-containing protein, partial [Pirellulaceae bacterium]
MTLRFFLSLGLWMLMVAATRCMASDPAVFLQTHCLDCHRGLDAEGGRDLSSLSFDLSDAAALATWVRIHDRVARGEMPPADHPQVDADDRTQFLRQLHQQL